VQENYQLRNIQERDTDYIIELLELCYGQWPNYDLPISQNEHFKWKWSDSPFGSTFLVSTQNDKIVGCSGLRFNYVYINGKRVKCHLGGEAAVHPEHRRKGLHSSMFNKRIENAKKNGSLLHTGITYNPILTKTASSRGLFKFPHMIDNWVYIWNPLSQGNLSLLKKIGAVTLKIVQGLSASIPVSPSNLEIREIDKFDRSIDFFWEKSKEFYCFVFEKSREYLNWRYCDPRAGFFQALVAIYDDEVIGYSVCNYGNLEKKQGRIADFMVLPGQEWIQSNLLLSSLDFLKSKGMETVQAWLPNGNIFVNCFESNGFIKYDQRASIQISPFSEEITVEKIGECPSNRVLYHIGDTDII
jgi:GNAT superfamily N-acetyltransferase